MTLLVCLIIIQKRFALVAYQKHRNSWKFSSSSTEICTYKFILQLAFESVALVSKALSLIEAGELGVISFGERSRVLHPLGEPFTTQTGAK